MESADKKKLASKKDKSLQRIRDKYPDSNFDDEEVVWGHINDELDELDGRLAEYQERERALSDMFTSDPRSASFLMAWKNGGDPLVEFVKRFGIDALQDEERREELAAANKEYLEKVTLSRKLDEEYERNLDASLEYIQSLTDNGVSEKEIDDAITLLSSVVRDGIVGKFSPASIEMARRALKHDEDVATAAYEGEVRGRNAKIEEKLRKATGGDGTARLNGSSSMPVNRSRTVSIFDIANEAR